MAKEFKHKWLPVMICQLLTMFAACTVFEILPLVLSAETGFVFYPLCMWGILPLIGAITAYFAVRHGLNAYAAWFLPPIVITAVHWAGIGYPPAHVGMPLLAGFLSLVGGAAGEEKNKRKRH